MIPCRATQDQRYALSTRQLLKAMRALHAAYSHARRKRFLPWNSPPPSCDDAIDDISRAFTEQDRESMARGLNTDQAMRVTRRGSTADVDLATRDSSGAGIHLQLVEGQWRIEGIDPGAVDGGQPTDDRAAIRRLQRPR